MSVMTTVPPSLQIVQSVRKECRRLDGRYGQCVAWIFDRLEQLVEDHPTWNFRNAWCAMKANQAWKTAGFCWDEWQRANLHVALAFDHKFQAPPKAKKPVEHHTRHGRGRRSGRRAPYLRKLRAA